jgi:hypothetical protein
MADFRTRSIARRLAFAVVLAVAFPFASSRLHGDDAKAASESGQRSEEMKQLVAPLHAVKIEGARRVPLVLQKEPLQRWNDPTREFSDGSLWLWTSGERPVAAVAVELYRARDLGAHWSFEFVSLSTGLVEADAENGFEVRWPDLAPPRPDGSLVWAPKVAGVEFKPIPDAPAPGQTESARLRQMKAQAQRFSGDEFYEPSKQTYVLRLLPRQVHRYADPDAGIIDGAIFLLAYGTNPEVMILIELRGQDTATARWHYGLARLSRAGPTVRLDQKVVWSRPHATRPLPDEVYFIARQRRSDQPKVTPDPAKEPRSAP